MTRLIRRVGTLVAAIALTGAGVLATTGAAAVAATPTVFNINGVYAAGSSVGMRISNVNDAITINMSSLGRPTAHGVVVDSDTIFVDFPDDQGYAGTLIAPDTIVWSNNSVWRKARQVPNVIGDTVSQATTTLQAAGFTVTLGGGIVDCDNLNRVARQTPGAGQFAAPGSSVRLLVGTRPTPPRVCE
jgi:hypothetical protein